MGDDMIDLISNGCYPLGLTLSAEGLPREVS